MVRLNPQIPAVLAITADRHKCEAYQQAKKTRDRAVHMYYEGQRVAYAHMHSMIIEAFGLNDTQVQRDDGSQT